MTAEQIYQLVNDVTSDALGKNAFNTVRSTADLVSLGETILSSSTSTDNFYNKLLDRIGKVYIKYRRYVADFRDGLVVTPLEFGVILQKIQTGDLADATSNPAWRNQSNPFNKPVDTTDIEMKLFSKVATWAVDTKIIYDYQLRTAFVNETNMGAFVNLIYNDMYNAMEVHLEEVAKLARATGMAQCIKSSNTNVKRNLLAEYKALYPTSTLTSATCLLDADFEKYASREINLVTKRIQKMSTLFNPAKKTRFTPSDALVVEVLADFATASDSYLNADTYHMELTSLKNYKVVDSWQATGTGYAFADVSSIKIEDEAQESAGESETTEQSGIIAYIRDKDAVGMMIDRIRTKSLYNPMAEATNVSHRADVGFYVDPTENGVVFYVAD